ncbi:uncharacterized protein CEXT_331621 [Caerostris extrusa]|uniref:Uncharacterized protein n=1 Tax=Caerostris extrusa TaxID=172846 RepID=A0AAV4NBF1_CAEEX|nr:uncharacterized protein CEXT_331621 [Caerostris extrusa]
MYRASGYRTKSLNKKLSLANNKLLILRTQTQDHAKVIEYMISHQNLMKLMMDPDTLVLDENVPRDPDCKEKATSIADMLDKNNDDLIKTEAICTENKRDLEILKNPPTPGNVAAKEKKKPPKENRSDRSRFESRV